LNKSTWKFSAVSRNVHRFDLSLDRVGAQQWFLLQSDVHWDNPHCQRKLFKKHLDQALERNAPVIDIGDFFCAMQGKFDKRSNKSDILPEHQKSNYLDALVDTAADYLAPYKGILTVRGHGNHESAIKKNHETDLVERLAERLKAQGGIASAGGFSGYVRFFVTYAGTRKKSFTYWYHHGHGGGGPVTRGVIQSNRHAVFLADADIVHTGHTHDFWQVPIARVSLNQSLVVEHSRQAHISTPGYKEEYGDGAGGWHIERGGPPKPTGAMWLRFVYEGEEGIQFELTEAR